VPGVQETHLPGIGVRFDFSTRRGDRIGVVVHRTGRRDLFLYSQHDPDACVLSLALESDDARTLADLLGATRISEELAAAQQDIEGLALDWIRVEEGAAWAGLTLAEAAVHTTIGVSIVALLRGRETVPAPGAAAVLQPGDTALAVGTPEGLVQLARKLRVT
jgi:TrkA domain protein